MMCSFKVGYAEARKLVSSALDLLVNQRLTSHPLLNYSCCCYPSSEPSCDNGKRMLVHVYDYLAWKLSIVPLHASFYNITNNFLLIFQHTNLVVVLHRKMVNWGTAHVHLDI
jgi:hypothetical protein